MAPERRSKAGFILPSIHGTCTQPMRRKGPNGYVTEACGKRNVKELPDGIQVCLGCFNKAQRHAEVEAKADKIRAKVEAQVISIRSRGVEAAIQENNGFPTGFIVVDPTQLLKVFNKLRVVAVNQAPAVTPRRRVKVSAR
jgi:hypothetical protein